MLSSTLTTTTIFSLDSDIDFDSLSPLSVEQREDVELLQQSNQKKRKFISSAPAAARAQPKKTRAPRKKKAEEEDDLTSGDDEVEFDDDGLDDEGSPGNPADAEKRQKRLVKNRRAAQLFRKRQKQYIIDLEKQVNTLAAQNAAYSAKVDLLSAENNLIKDQLGYLRTFISKAVQLSFSNAGGGSGGPSSQQQQSSQQNSSPQSSYNNKPPTLPPFAGNLLQHPLPLPLPHPHPHSHSSQHHSNHNRHIPPPSDLMERNDHMHHQNSPFERQ